MAETRMLAAAVRSGTGKGAARSVRREGRVPGVIYGGNEAPEAISLSYKEINRLIYAGHFLTTIFELDLDGRKERVIPRDYQLDVVKDRPLHVDFLRLKAGSRLKVEIPLHFSGQEESPGIKEGGSLNIVRHAVELWVPAEAIPEAIEIDVSKLAIGDAIHISDVRLPLRTKLTIAGRDFTIASVAAPMQEEVFEEGGEGTEGEAGAKPEAAAGAKPVAKADAKPGAKADAKPGAKADAKPGAKADAKPGAKPGGDKKK